VKEENGCINVFVPHLAGCIDRSLSLSLSLTLSLSLSHSLSLSLLASRVLPTARERGVREVASAVVEEQ
jgi:hypothetical protein